MKRLIKVIIPILILSLLLVGCGAKSADKKYDSPMAESSRGSSYDDFATEDTITVKDEMDGNATESTTAESQEGNTIGESTSVESNRKIIRNVSMGVETQEFDKVTNTIQKKITSLGGYAENVYMDNLLNSTNRSCSITARIPANKLDQFVNTVSEVGNVVSKNISAKDITLNYVDMESHVKVLKVEQERLIALIEKAVDLDSIILLENRLTDIRYDLENYQSQIRTYDNLVEYSTVNISIDEVIRYSTVVDKESMWDQMKSGLSDTMYSIKTGIENFAIFFVVNIPYIIFWGVVIIVIVVFYKKSKNKKKRQINKDVKDMNTNNSVDNDKNNKN